MYIFWFRGLGIGTFVYFYIYVLGVGLFGYCIYRLYIMSQDSMKSYNVYKLILYVAIESL